MSTQHFGIILRHWLRGLSDSTAPLIDSQLLERFSQQRDESAFEQLVQRHGSLVLGTCRRLLRDSNDIDDAFQATFLVLACRAGAIRRADSVAGFLHGTACRIARRLRSCRARQAKLHRLVALRRPEASVSPEDDHEELALLHEELDRLPRKYRDVLVLCYLQGKSHEQAAHELGYPLGSMSRHLTRARELLRDRLRGRGVGQGAVAVCVAVTPSLVRGTVETVRRHVLASALLTTAPPSASVLLAQGVLRAAWPMRVVAASVLLTVGVVVVGGMAALHSPPAKQSTTEAKPSAEVSRSIEPRRDLYGDPLPDGVLARMGTACLRHSQARGIAFDSDGSTLISTGRDNVIRYWDRATGKLKRSQNIPREESALAISPDGKTVVLAGKEALILWDVATKKEVHRLPIGQPIGDYSGDQCIFSSDGKTLAASHSGEGQIRIWDVARGKDRGEFTLERVGKLALSPDGKLLAAVGQKRLVVWDVATRKELYGIDGKNWQVDLMNFSADGQWLLDVGERGLVLREAATGKEDVLMPFVMSKGERNPGQIAAFAPDGNTIALLRKDQAILWDRSTRKEVRKLHGRFPAHPDPNARLCFSPDGKQLAYLSLGILALWDTATGEQVDEAISHRSFAMAVAFSPDGKTVASGAGDQTVRLWDARTGEQRYALVMDRSWFSRLLFTVDGKQIFATGYGSGKQPPTAWDVRTGAERQRYPTPTGKEDEGELVSGFALSPDGKRLIGLSMRWEEKNKPKRFRTIWDVATGERLERRELAFNRGILVGSEVTSSDGQYATVSSENGFVLYDLVADRPLWKLKFYANPAFSADNQFVSHGGVSDPLQVMDVKTGENRLTLPTAGAWHRTFSSDGRYLLTAEPKKGLRLWELATGKQVFQLPCYDAWSLAIAPDSRSVAVGTDDANVLIWNLAPETRQAHSLRPADLDRLWSDLAGEDAARAYRAANTLLADPSHSVAYLREKMQPISVDAPRVRRLIADLDSERFSVRDAACRELEKMEDAAFGELRSAVKKANSLELRRRLEALLKESWTEQSPRKLRQIRAIRVLEQIGDTAARRELERLATGVAEARQTREAQRALERLNSHR